MKTSDNIADLAAALSKAQSELEDASKDGKANYGKFATLCSVLQEIRPVFSKHGLAIIQVPWTNKDNGNAFTLTTTITHASGQWMSGELELILDKQSMQGMGSAISYARRYMASAMAGLSQEDDDGDEASKVTQQAPKPVKTQEPKKPAPHNYALDAKLGNEGAMNLYERIGAGGSWTRDDITIYIQSVMKTEAPDLTQKQAKEFYELTKKTTFEALMGVK